MERKVISFAKFTGDNIAEVAALCISHCPLNLMGFDDYELKGDMLWVNAGFVNGGIHIFKGETIFCYSDESGDKHLAVLDEPFAEIVIKHLNRQRVEKRLFQQQILSSAKGYHSTKEQQENEGDTRAGKSS